MTTLVEKMARAIDPSQWGNFDGYCSLKGFNNEERAEELDASPSLQSSLDRALAALAAMREPSPHMIASAWGVISADKKAAGIARLGPGAGFSEWWQATIDAAIQEHSSPVNTPAVQP